MHNDQLFIFTNWQKKYINEQKVLNRSKNTLSNYNRILNFLYEYYALYEDTVSFYSIDRAFIVGFLESRGDITITTKNLYIAVCKSFFTYISLHNAEGIDFRNRFIDLKAKLKKSEPKYLTALEYAILEKYLSSSYKRNSYLQYRNRLLLKLLLFTGVRASEVLGLSLGDFTVLEEEGVYKILVLGKGNKERYVYIKQESIVKELSFIEQYIKDTMFSSNSIALTSKGRVMVRSELYVMIEKLFKRLGIKQRGVHLLRHTFANKLVQKNVNLSTIKELMGHENIQTTMIYAHSDEGSMIRAVFM